MLDMVHCQSPIRGEFAKAQQEACAALPELESQIASVECMVGACVFLKRVPPAPRAA